MKFKTLASLFSSNTKKQYEARYDFVTALAHRWGLRTYNKNLAWLHDSDFKAVWAGFPESNKYIHERKFTLYKIAKSLRGISGDIAECGVFRAGSSYLMLAASDKDKKHLHGFDSFEGLSEPDDRDAVENSHSFKWKKNDMAVGEGIAMHNLEKFEGQYTLYKGWIPDRFNEVKDEKFSLVHIDVDLYEPTFAALEFFYPRMVNGGIIVCDDYGSEACPGALKAMDDFFTKQHKTVIHLTTGQGLVVCLK